ncbi:MAG: T9SS type A sorting domain-containing protein [Bacteroidota bacterium]
MVKNLFTLFLLGLFCLTATAGERYLVRIGQNGKQEAIQLKKGERAQDVIERLEHAKATLHKNSSAAGLIDTLKYYPNDAALTTNFGWTHQDVAFQWYTPAAGGRVKEFWWLNYQARGNAKKGTVRAWIVDPKLATRPTSALTKFLGYYKDPNDGDGLVTPYKPTTGNQWFYGNGGADSATWRFDPLGTEVSTWVPGGQNFTLDSNKWQGFKLEDFGDSMFVKLGQMFGFTLSNDTKLSDIPTGGTDERMEILSWANANSAPYHSFKWYEGGRSNPGVDNGWHMRGDYEWGMYTVIEYTTDRAPKVVVPTYSTTLKTTARTISATITDDNPGGGASGVSSAFLKYKKGSLASYDSVAMTASGSTYSASIPASSVGDTIYWYISTKDVNSNYTILSPRNYKIFRKTQDRIFILNNAAFSMSSPTSGANYYYNNKSTAYDRWSAPNDGTGEMAELLALYSNAMVADAGFPARNVYPLISTWLDGGTASAKRNFFFSSQDYGCYVQAACADTTFASTSFENKYLGVEKLGPQDQGSTSKPVKVLPQVDSVTNYLIKYNTDSSTTLWTNPTFELGFAGYPDFMTPTATAKALFKTADGANVYGVKNLGATFNTAFFAFDVATLQFRSDTSKAPGDDPKYQWISDIGAVSNSFFQSVSSVKPVGDVMPGEFTLGQNYPNPFNPSTVIEYNVPVRSNVEISIFNILGQKVASIINDVHEAGTHRATWNGKDSFGKPVASGIYFYQMNAGSFEQVKKMMLMK